MPWKQRIDTERAPEVHPQPSTLRRLTFNPHIQGVGFQAPPRFTRHPRNLSWSYILNSEEVDPQPFEEVDFQPGECGLQEKPYTMNSAQ